MVEPTGSASNDVLLSAPGSSLRMVARRLVVRAKDVVFVKGIVEAHDGLAHVFSEHGGDLDIVAVAGREAELEALVADLARELGGIVGPVLPLGR